MARGEKDEMIEASADNPVHLWSDEDSVQSDSDGNQCPKSGSNQPQAAAEQMSGSGREVIPSSEARGPESAQRPGRCPDVEVLRQVVANKGVCYPKYVFIQTKRGSNMYRLHRSFASVSPSTDQVIRSAPENLVPDGMVRETSVVPSYLPETVAVYPSGLTEEPPEDNPSTLVLINPTVVKSNEQHPVAPSSRNDSSSNEGEGDGELSAGEQADDQMSERSPSPESPTRGDPESRDLMDVNRQEAAVSQYRKILPENLPESEQIRPLSPIVINLNTGSQSLLSKYAASYHPNLPVPAPIAAPIPDPPPPTLLHQPRQLNVNVNPSSSQTMVSSPYGLIIVPKSNVTLTKSLLLNDQMRLRSTSTAAAPPKAAPIPRTPNTVSTLKNSGLTIKWVNPIITSPVKAVNTAKRPITVPPKLVPEKPDQWTAEMQMIRSKEYHEKIERQKEKERQRQEDLVTCKQCGLKFSTPKVRQQHEMIHRPKHYECIECGRKFRSKHNMESHVKDKHKDCSPRFKCSSCERAYLTDSQLQVHMKKHTKPKNVCEYCGKMFNFQRALKVHIFHAHKPDEFPVELLKDKCPQCNHIAECKGALVAHMRIHTGEKPFACKICHKTYRQAKALNLHKLVHTKERPYKCEECDKTFRGYNHRKIHMDRVHNKNPRFKCKECERVFYSGSDRMKHVRRHHVGVRNHACEICPKAFFEKQHLKRHMRRFHGLEISRGRAETGVEPEVILEEGSSGSQTDCSTSNSHPAPVPSKTLPQLISEILNE